MKDPSRCLSPLSPAGPPGKRKQFGALHLTAGMWDILNMGVSEKVVQLQNRNIDREHYVGQRSGQGNGQI